MIAFLTDIHLNCLMYAVVLRLFKYPCWSICQDRGQLCADWSWGSHCPLLSNKVLAASKLPCINASSTLTVQILGPPSRILMVLVTQVFKSTSWVEVLAWQDSLCDTTKRGQKSPSLTSLTAVSTRAFRSLQSMASQSAPLSPYISTHRPMAKLIGAQFIHSYLIYKGPPRLCLFVEKMRRARSQFVRYDCVGMKTCWDQPIVGLIGWLQSTIDYWYSPPPFTWRH